MSIKLSKCKANDHKFLFFIFVVINQLINFIVGPSTCQKVNNEREDVFKGKNSVIDQKNCRFKNGFLQSRRVEKSPYVRPFDIIYHMVSCASADGPSCSAMMLIIKHAFLDTPF